MDEIKYEISQRNNGTIIRCSAKLDDSKEVCECQLSVEPDNTWTISSWFTKNGYGGKGIGKSTMNKLFAYVAQTHGIPEKIEYIWNGTNGYVLKWLERNFDAICTCPIAVQKLMTEDDWSAHVYALDTKKVLNYFGL